MLLIKESECIYLLFFLLRNFDLAGEAIDLHFYMYWKNKNIYIHYSFFRILGFWIAKLFGRSTLLEIWSLVKFIYILRKFRFGKNFVFLFFPSNWHILFLYSNLMWTSTKITSQRKLNMDMHPMSILLDKLNPKKTLKSLYLFNLDLETHKKILYGKIYNRIHSAHF